MLCIYGVVGKTIRARRLHQGLTLEGLSELSDIHPSYIGQIERGGKKFSLKTLGRLSKALDTPVGALFAVKTTTKMECCCGVLCKELSANTAGERRMVIDVAKRMAKAIRATR